jgi:MFS family permease
LMWLTADSFTTVFWAAVLPAFLALGLILFGVHEPKRPAGMRVVKSPLSRAEIARLGPAFWRVVVIATAFTLARFSEAFLILKAQAVGLPIALVPGVLVLMNAVYALAAYPVGVLSDQFNRKTILIAGLGLLVLADGVLAFSSTIAMAAIGIAIWGLHMGVTQGLLATLVADTAPQELLGTAYGMFNFATGIALLAASVLAGGLWEGVGPQATFLAGAFFATVALTGLLISARATRS